ncbi:MAG: tRNA (adenosine(37)-N6)-dimethylallyltransferase MiaA [Erysipelothrix sp.]|jgi:tRNA dimethylallyltransferase|nr:tRNA (adenosine(37)-N6)-dimethylallyltransferase MiaA [Erysipelothrix sp.]
MTKVCVITGLTATGKSQLAIDIAKATQSIILSVDSVAVYHELQIASAAPTLQQQQNIPHFGINIVSIKEGMDVARFQTYALNIIKEAFSNHKNVVLVGGSGLYLNAILYDYEFKETLTQSTQYNDLDNETLYNLICEKDPQQALKIHINNRKRLIRALTLMDEISMSKTDHLSLQSKQLRFPVKIVTCDVKDRDYHRALMNQRVDQMIKDGLQEEVFKASQLVDFNHPAMSAIGVKQWEHVFNQAMSVEQCIEQIKTKTHQFAKRQRTWFKHQLQSEWLYVDDPQSTLLKKEECIAWMNNSHD